LRDVSDREETSAALEMSEALVRAMFDSALDAIVGMDDQGLVTEFNHAAQAIFGLTAEEAVGKLLADLIIPPSLRERHRRGLSRYLEEGKTGVLEKLVELTGMRSDGTEFPVELTVTRLDLAGPPRFVGFLRDITERKRLERDVLDIGIKEQRRIARDLHDGLGQELYGTALLVSRAKSKLTAKDAPEAAALSEIADLLQAAIGTMRNVVDGLHPLQMQRGGLKFALERMVADTARVHNIDCRLEWDADSATLDDDANMHLYYIAREALTNSAKHSGSQVILVATKVNRNQVTMTIEDDGVGMPPVAQSAAADGKGLRIMNYRARLIGGVLEIRRKARSGTRVICTVGTASAPGS
jgi:PAS domain S-box-containing protein